MTSERPDFDYGAPTSVTFFATCHNIRRFKPDQAAYVVEGMYADALTHLGAGDLYFEVDSKDRLEPPVQVPAYLYWNVRPLRAEEDCLLLNIGRTE